MIDKKAVFMRDKRGGAEGTRTPDPLHAMQVRYQLRHSPDALIAREREAYRSPHGLLISGHLPRRAPAASQRCTPEDAMRGHTRWRSQSAQTMRSCSALRGTPKNL